MVAAVLAFDGVGHRYAVTLMGGGKHGSDVRFIPEVNEGWLRNESRIATAKACAPLIFGDFALLARQLLVPVFQRRYCWSSVQWKQLWKDIASPRGMLPHAIGRVVIARERRAIVLVDGQQRCTTMMLLLCAIRDVARETNSDAAAGLISAIDAVLMCEPPKAKKRLQHAAADSGGKVTDLALKQAGIGLERLPGADRVRLVPSMQDRRPFCSLVLGVPLDGADSTDRAADKMTAAYRTFQDEARALLRRTAFEAELDAQAEAEMEAEMHMVEAEMHMVEVQADAREETEVDGPQDGTRAAVASGAAAAMSAAAMSVAAMSAAHGRAQVEIG